MNASWWLPSGAALGLALGLVLLPSSSRALISNGKATHVGDLPTSDSNAESSVTLAGRATIDPGVDFAASVLTLLQLLDEGGLGGAGELLGTSAAPLLPLNLLPRPGSAAKNAVFVTPGSGRPSVRFAIRRRSESEVQFLLKLSRAAVPHSPALCAGTPAETKLTTAIGFGDGVHAPTAVLRFTQQWECQGKHLRITKPLPAPSTTPVPTVDGDRPPTARLRTEQVTRVTGQPNVVLLDGTDSSDPDGTIASYEFSVDNRSSGAVAVGTVATPKVTFEVTLPPGDYTARLRVKDNRGAFSVPVERGFSFH